MIDHDEDPTLRWISWFKDFIVISQRRYGSCDNIDGEHVIAMQEDSYDIWDNSNLEYDTDKFRFDYTSIITPTTTFEYTLNTKTLKTLKVQPVNEYDVSNYKTKRLWATLIDGTQIPMSLMAWKGIF